MSKAKGSNAERELVKMFWAAGWAAMRAAGSGSTPFPCPDLLVGNKVRRLAIEVKATKDTKKYFSSEEIKELVAFSSYFGAEAWVGIKFSGGDWVFSPAEDLRCSGDCLVFDRENTTRGFTFKELTEQFF